MNSMDMFAGTAEYYDQFRPDLPEDVANAITRAVTTPIILLDLGCGTGRITQQLAPLFSDIIGVEPDLEMVKFARRRLEKLPATVLHSTAEDMQLPQNWQASLVLICRAFHWMDQHVILSKLDPVVAHDGVIAILSDNSFWHVDAPWALAVKETLQHYLGPERRTLMGTYHQPGEYFGKSFTSPVFTNLTHLTLPVTRQWTADQIVGYLYSTSFASHAVLGDRAKAFEGHIREQLQQLSPNDTFTEHNHFDILLARR